MNVDSQTFILFSLGADLILSAVLVFLWLRHSDEKHAIAWAAGQLALSAGTAVWYLGPGSLPKPALAAVLLAMSVAGFWTGTEYFLGKLQRRHLKAAVASFSAMALAFYAIAVTHEAWVAKGTTAVYGLTFIWIGYRLASSRNHYRWLGMVMLVRGLVNLAITLSLMPLNFQLWFIWSFLVKTVATLCLIHAVQEKIQKRYRRAIDSLSHGFVVHDQHGMIRAANERSAQLLGGARARQVIGTHVADWLPGVSREMVADHFRRFASATQYPFVDTLVIEDAGGRSIPLEIISSPHYERGQLHCMMLVMDISERKKKDDQLYRAAYYDSMTGFLNRQGLSQELGKSLVRARQSRGECAVLFIDIDKFKRINDSFGHSVGDQLLGQFAQLLRQSVRPGDLVARVGGDEFVIVLPELAAGAAMLMARSCAEHILSGLAASFDVSPQTVAVSASIGVACYPTHGRDAATLLRNADIAMDEVKKAGRGERRFYDPSMNAYARDALVIDGALRGAIAAGELRLVYQPITDAYSGKMEKVEALLRWHSATLGNVGPDRFIPVAEDSGLIIELGAWVLNEACRQLGVWRDSLCTLTVSINVSARQLIDPAFVGMVEQALSRNGLAPQQLELELTERVLISDGAYVRAALSRLRELGVSISLDDFGTGYSSLSYLTQFPLNTLKIDRAFVTDMERSERGRILVATIIAMGRSLGLKLVAEGVETAEQALALASMDCHYLQGYHISKPVAADDLWRFARGDAAIEAV